MNKTDLIKNVATQTEYNKKDVEAVVEEVFAQITNALVNREKVSIAGFGDFEARKREARTGRNPQTGEPVEIAEKYAPAFKAKKALKDAVSI
ncbi:HU family DNA-binding protein [Paenibacillus sp. ISL-20]|uniref:HU family DNA-binding protein n=1 Tax=Paenibacillus sp. ISL-20 TaxID=2819163 RepID=UPI001BE97F3D|nr:HU family DNA-binding protein [Paenibacillus sp. ISL-20]MBT2759865.1 HU family DNA-binding protein [Paenibacillus sp. ISL-20]